MPKIIKDIEETIFNAGLKLFGEKGYSDVDMKMIAKEAGIAVGTLYNYYSNKKQLFIKVFEFSWNKTFSKLDYVIHSEISSTEKIQRFIATLYEEIESRKGIGSELTKANVFDSEKNDKMLWVKTNIKEKMDIIVRDLKVQDGIEDEEYMKNRLGELILLLVAGTIQEHPDEKEMNIKFINNILKMIYCS